MSTWRTGKRVPINVYEDDRPICQCHTAVDAQRIVAAMNRVRDIAQELDDEFGCDCGADDACWLNKKAGKMYNTECGHAVECPKFKIAEILRKFGLEEVTAMPEETKHELRLDPDFRRNPQTSQYCVQCQRDIKDASKAVRVTVNWETWEFVLGGDELLGADCAKKFGLEL